MIALSPGLAWLAGGLVLMLLEALAPGAFMVWVGLAALCVGVLTVWLVLPFAWEVIAFAVFSMMTVALGLRLRRTRRPAVVNTPGSGLVGRTALPLAFSGREGRVRVGDSDWPARFAEAHAPGPIAGPLEVVGVDGLVLLVRPRAGS